VQFVHKAYGYVIRTHDGTTQVLVFRHPLLEISQGGIQIPKGTFKANETPLEAVTREIIEETGLTEFTVEQEIAVDQWKYHDGNTHQIHERHFFLLTVEKAANEWYHVVTGQGGDQGMVFHYFWINSPDEVEIARGHGDYLDKVFAIAKFGGDI
jgi:8-oxo-dGTP pyrophosphatase MutT (NUDIX family)